MDVITAGDGSSVGSVRVPTVDDARLAISQLHRHKVGYKRQDSVLLIVPAKPCSFSLQTVHPKNFFQFYQLLTVPGQFGCSFSELKRIPLLTNSDTTIPLLKK